jgi:hypothetical protein
MLRNKYLKILLCFFVLVNCYAGCLVLKFKDSPTSDAGTPPAKPALPIEAKFVSIENCIYLKISKVNGAELDSDLPVKISKWNGTDSKLEWTMVFLIKKDKDGFYLQRSSDPNDINAQRRATIDAYSYKIHLPELLYELSFFQWAEKNYLSFFPGDTIQIKNALCEPIVLQCPLKVSGSSDIKPDAKGKIDFVKK